MSDKARVIVVDLHAMVENLRDEGNKLAGVISPRLPAALKRELANGSTIFFLSGRTRDPHYRSRVENFLERNDIKNVFVSPSVPDHFDVFLTRDPVRIEDL